MRTGVIFDMDGVIFDTEALILSCWMHVGERYGITGLEQVFRQCIGVNQTETRNIVRRHLGEAFDYERLRRETSLLFHKKTDECGIPVKPGVRELLEYLEENGYRIGLASSTRREVVGQQLGAAGLLPFFQVIVGGDMVRHSKPHPEIYERACQELGVDPAQTYAIEDSLHGVHAAYSAGMKVLMVPDLQEPDEETKQIAFAVYPSLVEALGFFQQIT